MAHSTRLASLSQLQSLRRHFLQGAGLPFSEVLSAQRVLDALAAEAVTFRERLFTPLVTLWAFLSQVVSKDHSCVTAVARLLAYRVGHGLPRCSARTGSYCKARQRLPEAVLARLVRDTGRELQQRCPAAWLWHGRPVKIADGSSVSMPDTPANQRAYPQPGGQKAGLGFPVARIVVILSLACGAALDLALGPCRGKRSGETALFRQLHGSLEPGDVLLTDRSFCSYFELALLRQQGAGAVMRLHQCRKVDFRRGHRLGPDDHLVVWEKPARPEWLDEATYRALPPSLVVREARLWVHRRGFRTKVLLVATTLLDPARAGRRELAALYRQRWCAELDLRSIKQALQMDILRCKTPDMVRKEVWAHLLVYNLIRTAMAEAAREAEVCPRALSFAGARQTLEAFRETLARATAKALPGVVQAVLEAIASHRVGNRPDRYEPRVRKRRPKQYPLMREPREQARERLAQAS
jgi:Transposase DDE domain